MNKKQSIINLFAVFLIVGIVYLFTLYSSPVRETINTTKTAVAGAQTQSNHLEAALPSALKEDATKQMISAKEQVLDVKIGEIFSFVSQAGRIVEDIKSFQESIKDQVHTAKE